MVQKKGVSANEYRRGVLDNEEEGEEEVLAYEEYITVWLDKRAKRRCWPMRRGNLQGDALAPAARPRVRRQRVRVHLNADDSGV